MDLGKQVVVVVVVVVVDKPVWPKGAVGCGKAVMAKRPCKYYMQTYSSRCVHAWCTCVGFFEIACELIRYVTVTLHLRRNINDVTATT